MPDMVCLGDSFTRILSSPESSELWVWFYKREDAEGRFVEWGNDFTVTAGLGNSHTFASLMRDEVETRTSDDEVLMIVDCQIDHQRRRLFVSTDAKLEPSDIRWLLYHKANMGVWGYDTLSDERANRRAFTTHEVRDIARQAGALTRRHGRGGRVAIVVTGEANYGMARMYSVLAEDHHADCDVFRTVESAEAWLGGGVTA